MAEQVDERIIPVSRGRTLFQLIVGGLFGGLGLALAGWGVLGLLQSGASWQYLVVTLIGLLTAALLGRFAPLAVRTLRSPGMRLDTTGFEFSGYRLNWADIAGFRLAATGDLGSTHIRVLYRPGAATHRCTVLDNVGYYGPPTYISVHQFNCPDGPLIDTLIAWWQRYGSTQNSAN